MVQDVQFFTAARLERKAGARTDRERSIAQASQE